MPPEDKGLAMDVTWESPISPNGWSHRIDLVILPHRIVQTVREIFPEITDLCWNTRNPDPSGCQTLIATHAGDRYRLFFKIDFTGTCAWLEINLTNDPQQILCLAFGNDDYAALVGWLSTVAEYLAEIREGRNV